MLAQMLRIVCCMRSINVVAIIDDILQICYKDIEKDEIADCLTVKKKNAAIFNPKSWYQAKKLEQVPFKTKFREPLCITILTRKRYQNTVQALISSVCTDLRFNSIDRSCVYTVSGTVESQERWTGTGDWYEVPAAIMIAFIEII